MNCPYCKSYGTEVELHQSHTINRCPRCMRDMSCRIDTKAHQKTKHILLDKTKLDVKPGEPQIHDSIFRYTFEHRLASRGGA